MLYTLYLDKSISVIPIINRSKSSSIPWKEYQSRLMTCEEVDKHCGLNDGIAVVCGEVSNIVAIDIDFNLCDANIHQKKFLDTIPLSNCVKKGKKGETRFYKYNEGFKSKINLKNLQIEILTNGQYTIIPPSVHPDGMSYEWVYSDGQSDLLEMYDHLPELDIAMLPLWKSIDKEVVEKPALKGRNDTWKDMFTAMIMGGKSDEQIMKEYSYLKDKYAFPEEETTPEKFIASLRVTLKDEKIDERITVDSFIVKKEEEDEEEEEHLKLIEMENNKERTDNSIILGSKWIEKIKHYIKTTSRCNSDQLATAGTFSIISACFGHVFKMRDTYLNAYYVVLAEAGGGKSSMQKCVSRIMNDSILEKFYGGTSNMVSKQGLERSLFPEYKVKKGDITNELLRKGKPCKVDLIDELSSFIEKINSRNSYEKEMGKYLLEMYSKSSEYYTIGNKAISDQFTNRRVFHPCWSILGNLVTKELAALLTAANYNAGLIPRLLFFKEEDDLKFVGWQDDNPTLLREIQDWLKEMILAKFNSKSISEDDDGNYIPLFNEIELTDSAKMYLEEIEISSRNMQKKNNSFDHSPMYARRTEAISKVAVIHCICDEREVLEVNDLDYGAIIVDRSISHLIENVDDVNPLHKRIIRAIMQATNNGTKKAYKSYILRKIVQSNDPRKCSDFFCVLVHMKTIEISKNGLAVAVTPSGLQYFSKILDN